MAFPFTRARLLHETGPCLKVMDLTDEWKGSSHGNQGQHTRACATERFGEKLPAAVKEKVRDGSNSNAVFFPTGYPSSVLFR